MNKIVCDICGSVYPETADQCPICGSSREYAVEVTDNIPEKMPEYIPDSKKKSGIFSSVVRRTAESLYAFDDPGVDVPVDVLPEVDFPVAEYELAPKRRTSYVIVVLLTLLIGFCLITSVLLFFKYYLPDMLSWETSPKVLETEMTTVETTLPTETTIPCKSIVLTSGVPEIDRIGQYWLLHVLVMPEDTTDQLTFTSSDESIVTVTAEGRLCSVGEGTTTVVISCGSEQILCQVTVKLPPGETESVVDSGSETLSESVDETSGSQIVLKLKQTDISFKKKGVTFQLELDCALKPEDVAWMTLDPDVAICHDGMITVLGKGTTRIVAQYGDQQVYCIVRCDF